MVFKGGRGSKVHELCMVFPGNLCEMYRSKVEGVLKSMSFECSKVSFEWVSKVEGVLKSMSFACSKVSFEWFSNVECF